jgi:ankyrin repeat protein
LNNDLSKVVIAVLVAIAIVVAGFFGIRQHMHASPYNDAVVQAANDGDANGLKDLLAKGASPDTKDKDGNPILLGALNHAHLKAARQLIAAGADVNATDKYGDFPICMTIGSKDEETTKMLIEKHADLNVSMYIGLTPLMMAADTGDAKLVKMLVDGGADVNAMDKTGKSVIGHANHNQEMLSYLMAHGAK